jgi:hypothetical protein
LLYCCTAVLLLLWHPQVQEDFRRVFQNAKTYNPAGSDVYYMATVLQVCGGERGQGLGVVGLGVDGDR